MAQLYRKDVKTYLYVRNTLLSMLSVSTLTLVTGLYNGSNEIDEPQVADPNQLNGCRNRGGEI